MEKPETATSHEAIPVLDADAPYAGVCGQTRFAFVHLLATDGSLLSVSLCRAINVQTHPELRERAMSGDLHRVEGRQLALAFVYHDPQARKFALVLPAVLAHTELAERAKLLSELAQDTAHAIPLYVKRHAVVIGQAAFTDYVQQQPVGVDAPREETLLAEDSVVTDADDSPDLQFAARERSLLERERALTEQERTLVRMAEVLSAREHELSRRREQIDSARQALELHESAGAARTSWTQVGVANAAELDDSAAEHGLSAAVGLRDGSAQSRTHPPPLPGWRHRSGPPPLPPRIASPRPAAAREPSARAAVVHAPPPLPPHSNASAREPEVAPPAYFLGQQVGQLAVRLVADELWLFAHVDEADAGLLRHGAELFLQYVEVEDYPVVLLSLVASALDSIPMRLTLDGHSDADQRVLEHLSRSFRARVALYVRGRYVETLTVAALREGVAQAISDRMADLPSALPAISATDALLRVAHAPPALTNDDLPFGPARREASTTASVHASIAQLAAWLVPEKLREATLIYCTPRNVIEATMRRVLRAAVAFGIALPDELVERAVEQRVARDVPNLLRAQLQAFRQRVEQGVNDLGGAATRKNWESLLAQAQAHGVEVDESLLALVSAQPNAAAGANGHVDGSAASRQLQELTYAELLARLDQGQDCTAVIEELCLRGQPSAVTSVLAALPKLDREQLPAAVAHLLFLGEAAGDALIGALSAPDPGLRQLAALALGRLRFKRALEPLIKLLETDDGGIHAEVARALGDYGAAAALPLAEASVSSAHPDRIETSLAHVANHGGAQAVENLENSSEPAVAHVARKAMAARARIAWEDLAVRQQRTLEEADATTLLSQAFYAAVPKVAI